MPINGTTQSPRPPRPSLSAQLQPPQSILYQAITVRLHSCAVAAVACGRSTWSARPDTGLCHISPFTTSCLEDGLTFDNDVVAQALGLEATNCISDNGRPRACAGAARGGELASVSVTSVRLRRS